MTEQKELTLAHPPPTESCVLRSPQIVERRDSPLIEPNQRGKPASSDGLLVGIVADLPLRHQPISL
jgi:hypothetical protein